VLIVSGIRTSGFLDIAQDEISKLRNDKTIN
jgi:hypothetical protein